jgi:hypothetical protein
VDDDFGVGGALENVAVLFVFAAKEACVNDVAVVGDRDRAKQKFPQQRLGIAEFARAGCGIADVADGCVALEFFLEHSRREDLADEAHSSVAGQGSSIADDYSSGFLPAMLLGEEGLIGDV